METSLLPFSDEGLRIAANLGQRHDAWMDALRRVERLPSSMFFVAKGANEYLTIKRYPGDPGTTAGARSAETEKRLHDFQEERRQANVGLAETHAALAEIVRQYRALKLPLAMPRPARILRELDRMELLGTDLMVVGANAFAAYEIEAGCRFLGGLDATEDFDLAWCRGARISLSRVAGREPGSPLMRALQAVDSSFRLNERKPYQAFDRTGYEVELLVAPSLFATLPKDEVFSPLAVFQEQEWLLQGRPVRHVVVDRENKTCPIFAPDPRWMAMHKLWLAQKPERSAVKRPKDVQQGSVLLDAVRERMQVAYPLDVGFVLSLPEELRPLFDDWARSRNFIPH
jgi:hypothetical protein